MAICQNCGNNIIKNGRIWMENDEIVYVFCLSCKMQVKIPISHGQSYLLHYLALHINDWITLN